MNCKDLTEKKQKALCYLKSLKWKNDVAPKNEAYKPTYIEHVANIFTHGVSIPIAIWCSCDLIHSSHNQQQYSSALIYGFVLIGLFSVSTVFHTIACFGKHKTLLELLHRSDRAMIYLFIAGSYTPWLSLRSLPPDGIAFQLRWAIWVLATLGILYQQIFHEKYKWLETTFYLIIGILPGLLAELEMSDLSGIDELKLGGFIYVIGVIFFKSDGRIPLAHAIWHLHVVAGAMIHYFAVSNYLMGSKQGPNVTGFESDIHSHQEL